MIEVFDPEGVHRPASAYSQGALVTGPGRWLHVSGQIGARLDGSVPDSVGEQMEQMWDNLFIVLNHAGMTHRDIVKITVFLVDQRDVKLWRQIRDRRMEGHACAATLLIVRGLANPQLLCEIEAVAFQPV
jgi:2-iminobutanoate/2-iminopropanoate deaminase